jgi:hypothetical protein
MTQRRYIELPGFWLIFSQTRVRRIGGDCKTKSRRVRTHVHPACGGILQPTDRTEVDLSFFPGHRVHSHRGLWLQRTGWCTNQRTRGVAGGVAVILTQPLMDGHHFDALLQSHRGRTVPLQARWPGALSQGGQQGRATRRRIVFLHKAAPRRQLRMPTLLRVKPRFLAVCRSLSPARRR